jgi:hypothetical protein
MDVGTDIPAAEFRPAGIDRTDTFMGFPQPEEGAGNGFSLFRLLNTEEFPFIRVHGNDTFLAIGEPYPEFVRIDLLQYADYLPHSIAAVTATLTHKAHCEAPFF